MGAVVVDFQAVVTAQADRSEKPQALNRVFAPRTRLLFLEQAVPFAQLYPSTSVFLQVIIVIFGYLIIVTVNGLQIRLVRTSF